MKASHFAVHARGILQPLLDRDPCASLWSRLRAAYPKVLACVLMPDHLHLLLETLRVESAGRKLGALLSGWTREWMPGESVWLPVGEPTRPKDDAKLLIDARYIHLNPCKERLAGDPLEWEWSTYRDVMGAVADPWIDVERNAALLGAPVSRFKERIHRFTSCDVSVAPGGTPLPREPGLIAARPSAIVRAAAMALRTPESEVRHRSAVRALAARVGESIPGADLSALCQELGISDRTLRRMLTRDDRPDELRAARRLLADPRYFKSKWP